MFEGHMKAVTVTNTGIDHTKTAFAQDMTHLVLALKHISILGYIGSIGSMAVDIGRRWNRNGVGYSHNVIGILRMIIPR